MDAHVSPSPHPTSPPALVPLRLAGEERLARLVGRGNNGAFTVLYQRFHQPLYRYCRSLVGNDADAQDVLQTAFTRALVALRDGRRDAPLRPWLFRIAHNESISLLRRRRPEQELADDPGSTAPSPHEVAEERARLQMLLSDLGALPERQRGALVMRELSGLAHEDVAQALGISVGAAKQTVLEARRSLQEFSEGRGMSCDEIQQIVSDGDRRALRGRRVRAHLRDCGGCAAFAGAISTRRHDLRALAPALPPAAASGLLAQITGAGSGHGGGGLGATAGAAGKGLGAAVSAKALATGAVVLTTAVVGADTPHHLTIQRPASPATTRAARRSPTTASAAGSAGVSRVSPTAGHARAGAATISAHRVAAPHSRTHDRTLRSGARKPKAVAPVRLVPPAASTRGAENRANRGASSTAPGHSRSTGSAPGASGTAPGRAASAAAHGRGASATAPAGHAYGHNRSGSASPGRSASHRSSASASRTTSSTTVNPAGHTRSSPAASASSPGGHGPGGSPNAQSAATDSSTTAAVTTVPQTTTAPGHSGH